MSTEGINPKQAVGQAKPPHSTVPVAVLAEVGVGMLEGSLKYGRHNYRASKILASVYYDATRRHIDSWWEGEDIDPDSKLSHITKAICSLMVLRDSMINDMLSDDRPPKILPWHKQMLQERTTELLAKYPEPKAPFTEESHPAWVRNLEGISDVKPATGAEAIVLKFIEENRDRIQHLLHERVGEVSRTSIQVVGVEEDGLNHHNVYGFATPGFVNVEAYPGAFADLDELHGNDVTDLASAGRYHLTAPFAGTVPHFGYHFDEPRVEHPLVGDCDNGDQ